MAENTKMLYAEVKNQEIQGLIKGLVDAAHAEDGTLFVGIMGPSTDFRTISFAFSSETVLSTMSQVFEALMGSELADYLLEEQSKK